MSKIPHAGKYITEQILKPHKLTVYALAKAMQIPASRLHEIIKGRRGVSADTATRLAMVTGSSGIILLMEQNRFDLAQIWKENCQEYLKIKPIRYGHWKPTQSRSGSVAGTPHPGKG